MKRVCYNVRVCHDNAVAESFFNLLKRERIRRRTFRTREEARRDVFDYIEMFYNSKRKHGRNGIPGTHIQVLAPVRELDFFDTQSVVLPKPVSPLNTGRILMARPKPIMTLAFKVRDRISSLFGIKKIRGFSGTVPEHVQVGQMLDFFLVEHASDTVLTLTERHRNLDVMTCISSSGHELTITSSVKTHNAFGRLYMLPVGPAHKMIVRQNLKGLARAVPLISGR